MHLSCFHYIFRNLDLDWEPWKWKNKKTIGESLYYGLWRKSESHGGFSQCCLYHFFSTPFFYTALRILGNFNSFFSEPEGWLRCSIQGNHRKMEGSCGRNFSYEQNRSTSSCWHNQCWAEWCIIWSAPWSWNSAWGITLLIIYVILCFGWCNGAKKWCLFLPFLTNYLVKYH